ncbi:MAG TPA: hypothetical protein VFX48_05400, partial [Saprospiraceae bacterium]|nr:hypothetical protein [Saprospiraceae bacterium]
MILWNPELSAQGCAGLDADAGPDLFTCDPSQPVQLMGSFNGSPTKYYWTPTTWLSDPNATDPIVNAPPGKYKYTFTVEAISPNNLIVNGNFESGNSGFTHDYNYGTPGGTFGPGWLSVGTTPPSYNGGWANCGDHTTGSGNQLIVDGHTTPNSDVWCQTVSVISGRTYLFRFYVQSVYPVAPPNLVAKANNVTFGNVSGAGLCDWQMFEACFTANSGSVQLCIQETSNIGFGNDFTIDDIELYEKCMDSDEVEVEVVDLKARIDVPKLPRCASDIFDLNAIGSSAGPNISYQWSSTGGRIVSQAGLTAKGQGGGTYTIKVTYRNGNVLCEQEAEIEVDPADDLEGSIEVEGIANCNSDTIVLRAEPINGSGNYTYLWIPANKIHRGKNDPTAYVTEAGLYKVVIIDADSGCELELQDIVVSDTMHPSANLIGDTLIDCRNPFAELIGSPFDTTKFSYFWTLPDSSMQRNRDSIQTRTAGVYHLRVVDKANKCFSDRSINIRIDTTAPTIELGPDLVIDCIQTDVEVDPISSPGTPPVDYFWTLPSGTLPVEKNLLPKKVNLPGKVLLRIVNAGNGCAFTDSLNIQDLRQLPPAEAGNGSILNCKVTDLVLNGTGTRTDSTK